MMWMVKWQMQGDILCTHFEKESTALAFTEVIKEEAERDADIHWLRTTPIAPYVSAGQALLDAGLVYECEIKPKGDEQ